MMMHKHHYRTRGHPYTTSAARQWTWRHRCGTSTLLLSARLAHLQQQVFFSS